MALWLVRAGKGGEYEQTFFDAGRIYLTWDALDADLSKASDYDGIKQIVRTCYPDMGNMKLGNWTGQIWAFALQMHPGDWVATPLKTRSAIAVGEITGPYTFDPQAEALFRHSRTVRWLNLEVPRSAFSQDILYSLGAVLTICRVQRNDAEARIKSMAAAGWKTESTLAATRQLAASDEHTVDLGDIDLERAARDEIQRWIVQRFKGHGLERLVAALLRAQGYSTLENEPGPDGGKDILAAPGTLGFGRPRLCVQVKSQQSPVDRPTLDQLIGVMQNFGAEQGLLVSWGGFKGSVQREEAKQFFRVRLWDADDLVEQLLAQYEHLPEDIRAEIPLKRIWAVARPDDGEDE